jgi:long-chain fatty acid transport protein
VQHPPVATAVEGVKVDLAKRACVAVLLILAAAQPDLGLAGGFQTLEQGTEDVGRAMVGTVSLADSAASAWYNPAGMTRLARPEVQSGAMLIVGRSEFDPDSGTTVPGSDGGNAFVNTLAPGGLFYVYPVDERLAVGVSAVAPFVGSLDYADDWVGRYFVQEFDLVTYAGGPSIAYKLTGAIYNWSETLDLAFAYQFLDLGDADINSTLANGDRVSGDYDSNYAHFFVLSFQKRF